MLNVSGKTALRIAAGAAIACVMSAGAALAQGGGPRGQGGGPGGGMMGGGMMMATRTQTASDVPMPILDRALNLTTDEWNSISDIRAQVMEQQRQMWSQMRGQNGQRPDQATMQANREKMTAIQTKASADITAVLTPDQQTALTQLLQGLNDFAVTGLPADAYWALHLTADQITAIDAAATTARTALAQVITPGQRPNFQAIRPIIEQANKTVLASLNTAQQKLVTDYTKANQNQRGAMGMGNRGGRGGRGGPNNAPPPPAQ